MKERCFLCGGPVVNGRCTECGLDNEKNDRKYHLNTHNESGMHLHSGDCDDLLNQPRKPFFGKGKKKEKKKEETFDYREMLEQKKKERASAKSAAKKGGRKRFLLVLCLVILAAYMLVAAISFVQDAIMQYTQDNFYRQERLFDNDDFLDLWEGDYNGQYYQR